MRYFEPYSALLAQVADAKPQWEQCIHTGVTLAVFFSTFACDVAILAVLHVYVD